MDRIENREHWERLATEYGAELQATTKCASFKRLELDALGRWVAGAACTTILEIGCGHGVNGFMLADTHALVRYCGLDFSPRMITSAISTFERLRERPGDTLTQRLAFGVGDARDLRTPLVFAPSEPRVAGADARSLFHVPAFDIVFTDRMIINLASASEQLTVMQQIAGVVRPSGLFLMLENSRQTHAVLNTIRSALGLSERPPAAYNVFIDEPAVIEPFKRTMDLVAVEDFGSIHDLILYAVQPAADGGGKVEYDTPLMTQVTNALLAMTRLGIDTGHGFGQNRLWIWRKPTG
jgi:SAM-dependent methyltransferase